MIIDVLFCILLIAAVYKGYTKGFIVALFSFLAIIIGLAAALKLSAVVAGWLHNNTNIAASWLPFIAFALVMVGVILLVRFTAGVIQKSVELMLMGWANKIAGIVFYALLYICVFSVMLFFAVELNLLKQDTLTQSKSYTFIQPFGPKVITGFGKIVPIFRDVFSQLETFFDSIRTKATSK